MPCNGLGIPSGSKVDVSSFFLPFLSAFILSIRANSRRLLPVEGDELFKGMESTLEEIREFKSKRPGSIHSAASEA